MTIAVYEERHGQLPVRLNDAQRIAMGLPPEDTTPVVRTATAQPARLPAARVSEQPELVIYQEDFGGTNRRVVTLAQLGNG
jgi:hypothetical protein